jgi:DNA primase
MLDNNLRQEIQSHAADLIGPYVPSLRRQGKNLMGRCPFHAESTPSFSLSPERGVFYCFGCGVGGDTLTFLMKLKGLTFPEALEEAAHALGLPLPQRNGNGSSSGPLATAAQTAAEIFQEWLWGKEGQKGREYLHKRGITEETARAFGLGFHPDHPTLLLTALTERGIEPEAAHTLGLLFRKREKWIGGMRGRLIFPICDSQGKVRGFGARSINAQPPKYINSPDSPFFHKGHLLFGFPQAREAMREHKKALIVEGYTDVLALHQAGLRYAVSPLSTSVNRFQLESLRPFADTLTILFDGDQAGKRGITRVFFPTAEAGISVQAAFLPAGEDPDSYLRSHGRGALEETIAHAQRLDTHILESLAAGPDGEKAAREVLHLSSYLNHPIARVAFLQRAEKALDVPPGSLIEAAGIGEEARRQLEKTLCGLLLTVPEVQKRLRSLSPLPLRDPLLKSIAERTLRGEKVSGRLLTEAERLVQALGGFSTPHPPAR